MSRAGAGGSAGAVSAGRPTRARFPGEAFGLSPGAGRGVRRNAQVDVDQIATLRVWSVRLRAAATALTHLAVIVLAACAESGLVGPAGDALQSLGRSVASEVHVAARAASAAADELDQHAALLLTGWSDVDPMITREGRRR